MDNYFCTTFLWNVIEEATNESTDTFETLGVTGKVLQIDLKNLKVIPDPEGVYFDYTYIEKMSCQLGYTLLRFWGL